MISIEERVREGIVTHSDTTHYRTIALGDNLFLYKFVKKGIGHGGYNYKEDGYVLIFSDLSGDARGINVPTFVSKYS